jgi:nucleotide-binding universal stress UspA family protein
MKKIVLATDFSPGSEKALEVAIDIAKKNLSEITLLHCYSPTYTDPNIPADLMVDIDLKKEIDLKEKLDKLARKVQEKGIVTNYKLIMSSIAESINELSESDGVDFAVIGKTGDTGWLDKLLGSTAEHVINKVKIPLLVVPEKVESTTIDHIFYATQLEYDERDLLSQVFDFADHVKAKVELLNISTDRQLDLNNDNELLGQIEERFPNKKITITQFKAHQVEKTLLDHVHSIPNSVLSISSHHRDLFEGLLNPSMSKRMIAKTKVITLVLHFEE